LFRGAAAGFTDKQHPVQTDTIRYGTWYIVDDEKGTASWRCLFEEDA
jgi:hypothetical protein